MMARQSSGNDEEPLSALLTTIRGREARVAVIGLGYVGLPLLLAVRGAGFSVTGIDVDRSRINDLRARRSYLPDVGSSDLSILDRGDKFTSTYESVRSCHVIVMCLPTPLRNQEPDLFQIEQACRKISRLLSPGTLVILESTTYPGTTEEILRPILEGSGMRAGHDFALAYAPERIDPGRGVDHVCTTPRVVGGLTPRCTDTAVAFYACFMDRVVPVSSPRQAEMAKLIENVFRHVNIALINELAIISRDLGVDIWETIRAASTKPFGFMPFWPGPGVGGHCIAVDPSYLSWRVGQVLGHRLTFVEHAQQVNVKMPSYVVERVAEALNERGKPLKASRVLGLGLAYKPNVGDCRESPALAVLERLARAGARVSYHDPFAPEVTIAGLDLKSIRLDKRTLARQDCVVILTAHDGVDYAKVANHSPLILDTRGMLELQAKSNVIRL